MTGGSYSGGSVKCTSIFFCIYVQSERGKGKGALSKIYAYVHKQIYAY